MTITPAACSAPAARAGRRCELEFEDAVAGIDVDDRPLAYVFGDDPEQREAVLRAVPSGGACVNACALQGALPSLGFGGSGTSGMGRHHGIEGFREFSILDAPEDRGAEPQVGRGRALVPSEVREPRSQAM